MIRVAEDSFPSDHILPGVRRRTASSVFGAVPSSAQSRSAAARCPPRDARYPPRSVTLRTDCRAPRHAGMMPGAFGGDTAEYYAKFRRGYPEAIIDEVVNRLVLGTADTVIDLGCGTGLLTRPFAQRVRMVVGVDLEPAMLAAAQRGTGHDLRSRVAWMLGSDADINTFRRLLGDGSVGAITIGQALHFMDHKRLFREARPLLRAGGGIAIVANGTPLWQQDTEASRALRTALEEWFQTTLTASCGTDRDTQSQYAEALDAAGYRVHEVVDECTEELELEQVLGGLYSALSPEDLPGDRRDAFAAHIARALPTDTPFTEAVRVVALLGATG